MGVIPEERIIHRTSYVPIHSGGMYTNRPRLSMGNSEDYMIMSSSNPVYILTKRE